MMGIAKASWFRCSHCQRPRVRRRAVKSTRMREKHVTQKWLDEYENRPDSNTDCPGCGTDDDCNC